MCIFFYSSLGSTVLVTQYHQVVLQLFILSAFPVQKLKWPLWWSHFQWARSICLESVQGWPHRLWSSCSLIGRIVCEAWRKGADQIKSGGSLIYIGLEECVGLWVPLSHTFMIGYIGTHLWLVSQVQPGHDSETAPQCMASLNWIIHLIKTATISFKKPHFNKNKLWVPKWWRLPLGPGHLLGSPGRVTLVMAASGPLCLW